MGDNEPCARRQAAAAAVTPDRSVDRGRGTADPVRSRDVADVAAIAFASDRLVNGTFELASGGMSSRIELASLMSRYAGRDVAAADVEPNVALGGMPPGPTRDGLAAMFDAYTVHGFQGGNNLVLTSILGRPPRTLDAFLAELAQ